MKLRQCRQEISSVQTSVYEEVSKVSLDVSSDDALLLPSVVVPDNVAGVCTLDVTGIQRVAIASSIQQEREKTKKALQDAQYYRNLAKRLKTEKRQLANEMNEKVELVTDFRRNTIQKDQVEQENWCKEHF